ncbi:MAG: hypothetical protein B7C24_11220 [Bacteroidetes bacterium 4572_77]|nr:MAG: hypothetical protein B7C24_11220 [Bacteroidetes bacterium 4572_77]
MATENTKGIINMKIYRPPNFSETKLFKKFSKAAKSAGVVVVYPALTLFYLFKDKEVPKSSKTIIVAALAYFIFPADSIPDITPIIGYSDDLGILYVSLNQLIKYVTPDILEKVKRKIAEWFGEIQEINEQELKLLHKINTEEKKQVE